MDYAMQKHTAERDKEFEKLKKACDEQNSFEPLRLRFTTLFEELAEFKEKAVKRKRELKVAEQKYRDLERQFEASLAKQSNPEDDAATLNMPFKLDVIRSARETDDLFVIGDKQCTYFQHYFLLGDKLGKGGFETVYTATGLPNNRQHALKVCLFQSHFIENVLCQIIPKSKFIEKACNKRCVENEVRIQLKLEHENILSLQYCVQDKDHVYLLMEHCAENSLLKCLYDEPGKVRN